MAISPINLGGFYTSSGGQSVSSGLSSQLNTDDLIKALTSAETAQVESLNDQIDVNKSQVSALTELKQILGTLQTAVKTISDPSSFDTTTNLFAVRSSNLSSNTTAAASNFLSATVKSGTASGTYAISDITQLATYASQETNEFTLASATDSVVKAPPEAGFFKAGTITLFGEEITLTAGDSLADVAQAFNDASSATGIAASVLQTAPGEYKLIFTSTISGADAGFDFDTLLTLTSDPDGVFDNIDVETLDEGYDASFKLNGVTITRPSNAIDDLIEGVTFNLLQDTATISGAKFTMTIEPDTTSIVQGVNAFAAAYNNFLFFYARQTELGSDGLPAEDAVLFSDNTLRNIYDSITTKASSVVKGLSNLVPNSLDAVGVNFTDFAGDSTTPSTPNILSVDSSKLVSLLKTNFQQVANVFGNSSTISSPDLLLYANATNPVHTSFTVDVDRTDSSYVLHYTDTSGTHDVPLTATTLSTGGLSLKAPDDSPFAGLVLIYGSEDDTMGISVNATQGIAAGIKSMVDGALNSTTGLIVNAITGIQEKNKAINTQITNVNAQTATKKESLLQRYAALEAAITKANSVLNLLNAQQLATSN